MIFEASVDGRTVSVEVRRAGSSYLVTVDGRTLSIDVQESGRGFLSLLIEGRSHLAGLEKTPAGYRVLLPDDVLEVELAPAARGSVAPRKPASGPARITAPMPGKLVRVLVALRQEVSAGQGLLVMEAMKMENEIKAPRAGTVAELAVREGQAVETGALLIVLAPAAP